MRVLLINTSEKAGGAAIAAARLMEALNQNGVKAKMLVRDKVTDRVTVAALPSSPLKLVKFAWERGIIWLHNRFSMRNLWQLDIANVGTDITRLPEFQEADVIHLHWINQGFLSLRDLRRILQSGKRVVWTLHDQWPYTAICHYSGDCELYQHSCHHCPQLKGSSEHDLSYRVFQQKKALFMQHHITFVGCSQWIADLARKSALLTGQKVVSIPNAIPSKLFHPMDKAAARMEHRLPLDKKLVLFGSYKVTDERKGVRYLAQAYQMLIEKPSIVVVGKATKTVADLFGDADFYCVDYITDEHRMASLYAAVDAYVTPSLQDNLPNTIAEAMSCGTPCVGFHIGGIPQMIDHLQNGYVAKYRDAADLAQGIDYVLNHDLSRQAHDKASHLYGEVHVAQQYIKLYEE